MPLSSGARLGPYEIQSAIGAGGMGEVYKARDTRLDRSVAIKILPLEVSTDPDRRARFEREAKAMAGLSHPHICSLHDVGEHAGSMYLVMEHLAGETLAERLQQGPLPLEQALTIAAEIADALAAAHQHGVIHRDLKPANVMLTADGGAKVLDFGLAKLRPSVSASETTRLDTQLLTGRHVVMGTAAYMSPEQAEGRAVDHRSDIFSLGVVLYEMACGQRPFDGDTAVSVMSAIIKDTPPPLASVNHAVPPALERIVSRALAKDPAARYERAADLAEDLRQVPPPALGRLAAGLVRGIARSRWTRRGAAALALLAVAGAVAVWLARRGGESQTPATGPRTASFTRLTTASGIEMFPSLAPHGEWVVYAGQQEGNWDIYFQSTSGQKPINLTESSPDDDTEPAVSPDGKWIAFRSSRDGGGIFVMGRTGEQVRRVTPVGVSAAYNPAWSPDGTELAYATQNVELLPHNIEGSPGIWIVKVATAEQRQLDVEAALQPSWSPDGTRIAYVTRMQQVPAGAATRRMDISTIPAGGGQPVAVTNDEKTDWNPVWSPDGRYLYFVSDRGGSQNLWRVPVDEASGETRGEPEPITAPASWLTHLTFAADGLRLAFCAKTETANIQKITLDPETATVRGEAAWVTTGSQAWANPDPTADGEWVVTYSRDPEGRLYVVRPDGTDLMQVAGDEARAQVPRWSPDKQWIAFVLTRGGGYGVWKIRPDASGLQQVVAPGAYAVWSPDGTRIAVALRVVDANRSWKEQTPEDLPIPDKSLQPFIAQDWSRDGTRLVGFTGAGSVARGIVTYTFASRTYERITEFGEWPCWLPDNRRVLFVSGGQEFWVADTRTKETQKVFSVERDVLGPPRLTRDGRMAVFTRRVTEADIYLLTFQ